MRLLLLCAAALALSQSACSKCTPGDFNAPAHCTQKSAEGDSDQCTSTELCVFVPGLAKTDTRCISPCDSAQRCPAGLTCTAYAIGYGCPEGGAPPNPDGGLPQADCRTVFLCDPAYCGG